MWRSILFRTAPILVLTILLLGCRKKASDEIDFGTFSGSTYNNKYFGLTVAIPTNWSIQDQEAQRRLVKLGTEAMAGEDKNMKAIMKASELQTVNLFAAFKHPLGSPVDSNPALMSIAERVRHMPGIQRGKDYHFQMKKVLATSQIKMSFPKEIYSEQLGGVDFDVMDSEMEMGKAKIRQKYYATIKKGYALCFITTFSTDEEQESLHNIVKTVGFR